MDGEFRAELWKWRGPAPYYWLTAPESGCELVRAEAREASYGWRVLPVKDRVRGAERIAEGDVVAVGLSVAPRVGREADGAGPTG